jgi:hypothetical protein
MTASTTILHIADHSGMRGSWRLLIANARYRTMLAMLHRSESNTMAGKFEMVYFATTAHAPQITQQINSVECTITAFNRGLSSALASSDGLGCTGVALTCDNRCDSSVYSVVPCSNAAWFLSSCNNTLMVDCTIQPVLHVRVPQCSALTLALSFGVAVRLCVTM